MPSRPSPGRGASSFSDEPSGRGPGPRQIRHDPEERVRQALLAHLRSLGVPSACTRSEFPLSSLDPLVRDRADVVVFRADGSAMVPVLLAECKAPEVPLTESVFAQVRRYQRLLPAPWIVVTNGRVLRSWRLRDGAWAEEVLPPWEVLRS